MPVIAERWPCNTFQWNLHSFCLLQPVIEFTSQFFGSSLGKVLYQYFNFSAQVLLPRGFYHSKTLTPALKQQYLKPFSKSAHRLGTWHLAKALMQSQNWYAFLWQNHAVLAIKPMLILWGKHDQFLGHPFLYKWHMHFLQAKVIELEAGHFLQEEKPMEILQEIKEFLKN